jgi:hypothetical protein
MKKVKWFLGFALAAGMGLAGTPALSAAGLYGHDNSRNVQEVRYGHSRIDSLRAEIARDRARLNEDRRHGRDRDARRDAAELARDQRELNQLLRGNNDFHRGNAFR